jgi:transposase
MNPIEQAFAKIKAHLRKAEARTFDAPSATSAISSSHKNAGTSSRSPDMRPFNRPML